MSVMCAPSLAWSPAPLTPALAPGVVHLWRRELAPPEMAACECLSAAEWARAGRFHFQADRDRFLATRVFVRTVLAGYLQLTPQAVRFGAGPHGKPCLAAEAASCRFNLSHSGDLLVLAVSQGCEVGVDIELMRPEIPFADLATHYFPAAQAAEISALPAERQPERFYQIWTAVEARLKAAGTGIIGGLEPLPDSGWAWRNFHPGEGFAGALAVEGPDFQLECWTCLN